MAIVFELLTSGLVLLGYLGVLTYAPSCWHYYNNSATSYELCTNSTPQETAKGNCTERNMTLAVLSDPEVFDYWLSYLKKNLTYNNVWIGAKCTNATTNNSCGSFAWDLGGPVNTSYLAREDLPCCGCVLLNTSMVSSLRCNESRGFMCQRKLHTTTTTVTTVSDTTSDATTTEYVTTSDTTSATTWMSYSPTTTTAVVGNSSHDCWCGCTHTEIPVNKTDRDALAASETEKIKTELLLDTETLSKTVRRKTSANDDRPSAQNIGYTGVAMLVTAGLLIVLMDVNYVIRRVHGVAVKLKSKAT